MAYTKYSLTPANNNAAPPDGAPEGMLPSAVNDTMRDMMAQIRDAGDGIRNGTYTMTAPVITGGSITGVALSGNTLTNPVITGGSINNTPIGASTANTGAFTTLGASGVATFSAGTVSAPAITTTGDTNTGIFFPAADTIAFTEGGLESMRITSAGFVGIGLNNPSSQLQFTGYAQSGDDLTTSAYKIGSQGAFLGRRQSDGSTILNSGQTSLAFAAGNTGSFTVLGSMNNATGLFNYSFQIQCGNDYTTSSYQIGNQGSYLGRDSATGATRLFTGQDGIIFGAGASETMRIAAGGNVGIGTSSPDIKLVVSGSMRATQSITVGTGGTYEAGSLYSDSNWGMIIRAKQASPGVADFSFQNSAATERMRISSTVLNLIGLQGIEFQATQSASSNANTLDDYEEGTWTPTYQSQFGTLGSITYAGSSYGSYTKIGRMVVLNFNIGTDAFAVGTGSGAIRIAGLPFTAGSNTAYGNGLFSSEKWSTNNPLGVKVLGGNALIELMYKTSVTGNSAELPVTSAGTGSDSNYARATVVYFV